MNNLFKKDNVGQLLLTILFIIYLIMGYKTPETVAIVVDNLYGKIAVIVAAIALFAYTNPIFGVLGLMVAFDLIRRSANATGTYALDNYMPTEKAKFSQFTAFNQFPYTLEQEVVKKMAPIIRTDAVKKPATFKPTLSDLYDAAPINYNGVI